MIQTIIRDGKTYAQINDLHEWDQNPKEATGEGIERLRSLIKKLGVFKPSLVMPDGTVIGGNQRLKAYRLENITEVWLSQIDFIEDNGKFYAIVNGERKDYPYDSKEQGMLEYALADNDRVAGYIEEELRRLVNDLQIDTSLFTVDLGEPTLLTDFIAKLNDGVKEDEPPTPEVEAVSQRGQIYQLGKHRLMCGDATSTEDLSRLMNDARADLIFTDPPYNVDYEGKTKDALKIENDKMANGDFYQFLLDAFTNMNAYSKSGSAIYVCHADSEGLNFRKAFIDAGFLLKQCIIWNKNSLVMGRQDYQWKHEPILYGWKQGESHTFYGGRDKTTVWNIDRPTQSSDHPTMKPIALIAEALKNSSKGEDIVLDPFGGSGSTLVACEQTGRICYTTELDPKYVDVIRKRYWKLTHNNNEEGWQEGTPAV